MRDRQDHTDWHDGEPDLLIGRVRSDCIALWVVQRLHPEESDYWDGNWLAARIRLTAGGIRAKAMANLRAEELVGFREALEKLDSHANGEAVFETMEGWLKVRMAASATGSITVDGHLMDEPGIGNA